MKTEIAMLKKVEMLRARLSTSTLRILEFCDSARMEIDCRALVALLCMAILCNSFAPTSARGAVIARSSTQGAAVSVGVLPFQDDSGSNASADVSQKIAQEVQRKLNASSKSILARPLNAVPDNSQARAMTIEQLVALGKQSGLAFVIRGGLLAINSEGGKTNVQLYAEVISIASGSMVGVRAEGTADEASTTPRWSSVVLNSAQFRASPLGKALMDAVAQLSSAIQPAIASPSPESSATVDSSAPEAATESGPGSSVETTSAESDSSTSAEADEELKQLISQAESILAGNSGTSTDSLSSLSGALEGLKSSFSSKATILEQRGDVSEVDRRIATQKEELQAAINSINQQEIASNESGDASASSESETTGERKNVLMKINENVGEAFSILQKIQEIRSLFRRANEESQPSSEDVSSSEASGDYTPAEAPLEEIDGAVTEDGAPVEGVTVTDPESGATDTTDSDGSYNLKVPGGEPVKLLVSKDGKQMTAMQVDVVRGRSSTADVELKPRTALGGSRGPLMRIIPSAVAVDASKARSGSTGVVKGVVRDAKGQPVPRAQVNLRGLGVARTDSQGRYLFTGVPAGTHELAIRKSGLKPRTARVQVAARKSSESKVEFAPADKIALSRAPKPFVRSTGTVLYGTVLDDKEQPVAGARVRLIQPSGVQSVMTSAKGGYRLSGVNPGSYRVSVSKVGYESGTQAVALRAGAKEQRNFNLKRKSSPLVARVLEKKAAGPVAGAPAPRASTSAPPRLIDSYVVKNGKLQGRITELRTNRPVVGAIVTIENKHAARTDQTGNYVLALPAGDHRIIVEKAGFVTQGKAISIRSGQTMTMNLQMTQRTAPGVRQQRRGEARP
jgi:protocatechuate 3,4-dioxygenase beta subunit